MKQYTTLIKFFIIFLILGGIYLGNPLASYGADISIVDYSYDTHFSPGETVKCTITLKNNTGALVNVYGSFILTKYATTTEITKDTATVALDPGATVTRTTLGWTAVAGLYTVTIISYKAGVESQRISAPLPVHVGTTTDSVAAFPRMLDLGALQYGRYMHPMPVEISWSFYSRSTQVRKDHPWYMRIYTDNHKRYEGINGAIYSGRIATQEGGSASAMGSPAGLISSDGKYTIPLKVWCLNFGPDVEEGWDPNLLGPPPVQEDYYWKGPLLDNGKRDNTRVTWEWIPDYIDMSADNATWRKLIGQDSFDTHYVSDSNPTGDFTLTSPFQIFLAYETSPTAVVGKYSTDLIIEIYSP